MINGNRAKLINAIVKNGMPSRVLVTVVYLELISNRAAQPIGMKEMIELILVELRRK